MYLPGRSLDTLQHGWAVRIIRVYEYANARQLGRYRREQLQLLRSCIVRGTRQPRRIAPGACKACNETVADGIGRIDDHDRNCAGRSLGRSHTGGRSQYDYIDIEA